MENENGTNAGENNGNPAQTEQVVVEESNREIADISDSLSGLVSKETLESLKNLKPKEEKHAENKTGEGENKTGEEGGDGDDEGEGDKKPEGKTEASEEGDSKKKNVLGLGNKKPNKKDEIVTENIDQVLTVVKTKFGQDLKDVKDLPKFFETASKWRADAQKVEEISKKKDELENIIAGLPEDLISSMQAFYDGKDYTKVFSEKPKFNFDLPVEKQDLKELVKHYFPNKFSDQDFEVEEGEEKPLPLQIAEQASIDKFNAEKQSRDAQRAKIANDAKLQQEAFKSSVAGSVKVLKQSFPEADETEVKNIQKMLEGGPNAIVSYFCNPDGTIKDIAAESLMMAIHGKGVIEDMMSAASHATETKLNEEILSRGNESRKAKQGNGVEQISEEAKKVLNELNKFKSKTTF